MHVDDAGAAETLSASIRAGLEAQPGWEEVVLICIGTDRSTGDALGPLVGSRLAAQRLPGVEVRGTLAEPVHAVNLGTVLAQLEARRAGNGRDGRPRALHIAVDACLGRAESVGSVTVRTGPLRPGTGVYKELPPVGDLHIVGVVNVGGFMEYLVLQNTRLWLVMRMADLIADALGRALRAATGAGSLAAVTRA